MPQPVRKKTIEAPDVLMLIGLILLFTGLGFTFSWPVALMITGAVLIALAIWLVEPKGGVHA
jgi:membrane-bound ClpP family serine protease